MTGQIIDQQTNETIPYASVYIEGTTIGTLSDMDGNFSVNVPLPVNKKVLIASFMGYSTQKKKLNEKNVRKKMTIKLKTSAKQLDEVVIRTKKWENPAWAIMRAVQKNKSTNDREKLKAYEYESYTRTNIWVGNVNENFKKKKVVQDVLKSFESFEKVEDENGQPIIPIFASEVLSNTFYIKNPDAKTEQIIKSRIRSVGPDDDEMITQVLGSSFVDFNLYDNNFLFIGKSFISPITSEWRNFYDYTLDPKKVDVNGITCHKIAFEPRREEDLAFAGNLYIADSANHFALVKIDGTLGQGANINFIDSVFIDQSYTPIVQEDGSSAWMPLHQNFVVSVGKIGEKWAKVKIKIKIRNKDFVVNEPKSRSFYEQPVLVATDAYLDGNNEEFWDDHRHEKLSSTDAQVFSMIDSAEETPRVKRLAAIGDILISGHKKVGPVEFGPWPFIYAGNSVEKHRFQIGLRTNNEFSNKFSFSGFGAYGIKDKKWKYGVTARAILNREKWSIIGIQHFNDLSRVSVNQANFNSKPIFLASLRWGDMRYPYMEQNTNIWYESDVMRGLNVQAKFTKRIIDPLFPYKMDGEFVDNKPVYDRLNGSEFFFKLTYGLGYKYIATRTHNRKKIAQDNRPRITIDYTIGIPDLFGSNYKFQQIRVGLDQKARLGKLGTSTYTLSGGYIPTKTPFPLLAMPFGNNVPILYNQFAFNMMNLGEFVADKWTSLQLIHRFEGNLLNRIPFVKRMGWRAVGMCNVVYGDLSEKNRNQSVLPQLLEGESYDPAREAKPLDPSMPYVELGTGVENVFKVLRVYTIWRTTYRTPTADNFAVYLALGISF
ncbi:TonB-dependent receptor [Flammeovirga aprica JL-4]|uniref:TonB-dependent receptor n=1 Tax=Flammeovirga aprica JL-4 TaxID=694437 RepID=A0A7X9NZU6_9BACT|nr:TonB-dependent receptor [Flammeovirga aprica JL-4]